jgi:hypothetical protein
LWLQDIAKMPAPQFPVRVAVAIAVLWLLTFIPRAAAVPAFARQTGQNCVACHVSFPELTLYGRYFELMG